MQGEEFEALKADIFQHGQRKPIILTDDGQILDGRNRYRACQALGYDPFFERWQGDDPVAYVLSLNLHRRHLTTSQRAAVAAEIEEVEAVLAKQRQGTRGDLDLVAKLPPSETGKAREKAAQKMNVGARTVSDAKAIKQRAPELHEAIKGGEVTLQEAKRELRKREQVEREEAAKVEVKDEPVLWHITSSQDVVPCDAVLTDPPYGILDEDWEPADLEAFTKEWAERWNDCGADLFVIFWSQRYLYEGRAWFDEVLSNYEYAQTLVWHYPNNKGHQSRRMFKQTWEPAYYYRKRGSEREVKPFGGDWGSGLTDFDCHVAAVPQSNFNDGDRKQHPAQKPVSVMKWLVNSTTEPGELIVDPFMGSGTTGIAASSMGRRFHGIEIDAEYLELAERRLAAYGRV